MSDVRVGGLDAPPQDREPGEIDLTSFRKCPLCGKLFFAGIDLFDHLARHRAKDTHG